MEKNYIAEILKSPSIFKDEAIFDVNFLPSRLFHRENEIKFISTIFSGVIQNPFNTSGKLLITGNIGLGKTVTVKYFGNVLQEMARKYDIKLKYIHINCRIQNSSYNICYSILKEFIPSFPKRGYSTTDIFNLVVEKLTETNTYLFLVLDEIHYLLKKNPEILYLLTRFTEMSQSEKKYLSFIGISRDTNSIRKLDRSVASSLQKMVLNFKKYSFDQILDILKHRVKDGFEDGVISEEVLEMIIRIINESSDIRYGLNLLWKAGKMAEMNGQSHMTPDLIREANIDSMDSYETKQIDLLNQQSTLILLSILRALRSSDEPLVSSNQVQPHYEALCHSQQVAPLKTTQIWEYIKSLEMDKFISTSIQNRGMRGRRLLMGIDNLNLDLLENILLKHLNG